MTTAYVFELRGFRYRLVEPNGTERLFARVHDLSRVLALLAERHGDIRIVWKGLAE